MFGPSRRVPCFSWRRKRKGSDNERPIPQPPGTPLFLRRSQEKEGAKVAARRAIRRRARKVKRVERSDDQAWQRRSRRRAQLALGVPGNDRAQRWWLLGKGAGFLLCARVGDAGKREHCSLAQQRHSCCTVCSFSAMATCRVFYPGLPGETPLFGRCFGRSSLILSGSCPARNRGFG